MSFILKEPYEGIARDIIEGKRGGRHVLERGLEELEDLTRYVNEKDFGVDLEEAKLNYALLLVCLEDLNESKWGFSVALYKGKFNSFMRCQEALQEFRSKDDKKRRGGRSGVSREKSEPGIRVISTKAIGLK